MEPDLYGGLAGRLRDRDLLDPRTSVAWVSTLVQVAPPSIDRSTSAFSPPSQLRSWLNRITGAVTAVRSTTGLTSEVSCAPPGPYLSLSMIANLPLPPVRLPRLPGSLNCQTWPLPLLSTTVQPLGVAPESNVS